jgi:ceramide glucosyltransferase
MSVAMLLTAVGGTVAGSAAIIHWRLAAALAPREAPPGLATYPSVTIIRPIRGLDVGAAENIRAAFANDYPGRIEILFVFDDDTELALPLVRAAIEANAKTADARVVFSGHPRPGRTGKLNAMIAGLGTAHGELVAFVDSDTRPGPHALTALVDTLLSDPEAGAAFAPVVATSPPQTAGDVGYSLLLNGLYGPEAAFAAKRNAWQLPFIMGQFMIFKRPAIAAIGGLECADGQLVDDMYIGARVHAAGLRNRVSPEAVPIIEEGLGMREFWQTYVRWIAFSRTGLSGLSAKWLSVARGALFWLGILAGIAALLLGHPLVAVVNLIGAAIVALSAIELHHELGGGRVTARLAWVAFMLLLAAPFVLLATHLHREVTWRGRTYQLNAESQLAGGRDPTMAT